MSEFKGAYIPRNADITIFCENGKYFVEKENITKVINNLNPQINDDSIYVVSKKPILNNTIDSEALFYNNDKPNNLTTVPVNCSIESQPSRETIDSKSNDVIKLENKPLANNTEKPKHGSISDLINFFNNEPISNNNEQENQNLIDTGFEIYITDEKYLNNPLDNENLFSYNLSELNYVSNCFSGPEPLLYLNIKIFNREFRALLDSGATRSFVSLNGQKLLKELGLRTEKITEGYKWRIVK